MKPLALALATVASRGFGFYARLFCSEGGASDDEDGGAGKTPEGATKDRVSGAGKALTPPD